MGRNKRLKKIEGYQLTKHRPGWYQRWLSDGGEREFIVLRVGNVTDNGALFTITVPGASTCTQVYIKNPWKERELVGEG